ncbi:MAG: thiol peroxidase [Chitinispirillaceae bacterium]|nr:thiol peroxidase [Chitinispirillaceae bacterium]
MAAITLHGQHISTIGSLPPVGLKIPEFLLTKTDLSDVGLHDFAGKRMVFNIFPSIDTAVCSASVRRFNKDASSPADSVVLCVSQDLPFAHSRFCGAEGIDKVIPLSAFRSKSFGASYGVMMVDGPMAGLFSRAVIITDADGWVLYTEQVPEIAQEPDYKTAFTVLKKRRL